MIGWIIIYAIYTLTTSKMRAVLIITFWIIYYLLIGGLCCWYFHKYKKKEFEKDGWTVYFFLYGIRLRIGLSGIFAIFTADLCLYGAIQIISG